MKKYSIFSCLILLSILISPIIFCEEEVNMPEGMTSICIRSGICLPMEDYLGSDIVFSLGVAFGLMENVYLEADARLSSVSSTNDMNYGEDYLGTGSASLGSFNLSLSYSFSLTEWLDCYLAAGGGYSLNSFSPESEWEELGFTIDETIDNSISLHAGIGFNLHLFENFALNIDSRFSIMQADGEWSITDNTSNAAVSGSTETDFNNFSILVGLRMYL